MLTVCDTKVIYETEYAAQVGVAKAEGRFHEEFMYYECYHHYHISHKDPEKRRGAGKNYFKCQTCLGIFKKRKTGKRYKHDCKKPGNVYTNVVQSENVNELKKG